MGDANGRLGSAGSYLSIEPTFEAQLYYEV